MMSRAVHDWSLHRTLARFVSTDANPSLGDRGMQPREADASALALLDLPGELAPRGYDVVQLCHFHPSSDISTRTVPHPQAGGAHEQASRALGVLTGDVGQSADRGFASDG